MKPKIKTCDTCGSTDHVTRDCKYILVTKKEHMKLHNSKAYLGNPSTSKSKLSTIMDEYQLRLIWKSSHIRIFEHTLKCKECAKLLEQISSHDYRSQREFG